MMMYVKKSLFFGVLTLAALGLLASPSFAQTAAANKSSLLAKTDPNNTVKHSSGLITHKVPGYVTSGNVYDKKLDIDPNNTVKHPSGLITHKVPGYTTYGNVYDKTSDRTNTPVSAANKPSPFANIGKNVSRQDVQTGAAIVGGLLGVPSSTVQMASRGGRMPTGGGGTAGAIMSGVGVVMNAATPEQAIGGLIGVAVGANPNERARNPFGNFAMATGNVSGAAAGASGARAVSALGRAFDSRTAGGSTAQRPLSVGSNPASSAVAAANQIPDDTAGGRNGGGGLFGGLGGGSFEQQLLRTAANEAGRRAGVGNIGDAMSVGPNGRINVNTSQAAGIAATNAVGSRAGAQVGALAGSAASGGVARIQSGQGRANLPVSVVNDPAPNIARIDITPVNVPPVTAGP